MFCSFGQVSYLTDVSNTSESEVIMFSSMVGIYVATKVLCDGGRIEAGEILKHGFENQAVAELAISELASKRGIPASTVGVFENGKLSTPTIDKPIVTEPIEHPIP